jgi:hypothetical protein
MMVRKGEEKILPELVREAPFSKLITRLSPRDACRYSKFAVLPILKSLKK